MYSHIHQIHFARGRRCHFRPRSLIVICVMVLAFDFIACVSTECHLLLASNVVARGLFCYRTFTRLHDDPRRLVPSNRCAFKATMTSRYTGQNRSNYHTFTVVCIGSSLPAQPPFSALCSAELPSFFFYPLKPSTDIPSDSKYHKFYIDLETCLPVFRRVAYFLLRYWSLSATLRIQPRLRSLLPTRSDGRLGLHSVGL